MKRHIEQMREVEDKIVDYCAKFLLKVQKDTKYEHHDKIMEMWENNDIYCEELPYDVVNHYVEDQDHITFRWWDVPISLHGLIVGKIAGDMKFSKNDIKILAEQMDRETNGFFLDEKDFFYRIVPTKIGGESLLGEEGELEYVVRHYFIGFYDDYGVKWDSKLFTDDEGRESTYMGVTKDKYGGIDTAYPMDIWERISDRMIEIQDEEIAKKQKKSNEELKEKMKEQNSLLGELIVGIAQRKSPDEIRRIGEKALNL